jgi:hypothetical protein
VWIHRESANNKGIREPIFTTTLVVDLDGGEGGCEDGVRIMTSGGGAGNGGDYIYARTMMII